MKYIKMVVLGFVLAACTSQISQKQLIVNGLSAEYIKTLKANEQMILQGSGGKTMVNVQELFFDYACPKLLEVNEARIITLRCIDVFLNMVNSDTAIRPFLEVYPFHPSGLELIITFYPFDPLNPKDGHEYVYQVFFVKGSLSYWKFDVDQQTEVKIHKETYEEALQKVNSSG